MINEDKITAEMRDDAEARRRAGLATNGVTIVDNPVLKPLMTPDVVLEDYRDTYEISNEREKRREWHDPDKGKMWPDPAPVEWRNGGWYHMKSGKRVHTPRERDEAISMYLSGTPSRAVAKRFETAPATI